MEKLNWLLWNRRMNFKLNNIFINKFVNNPSKFILINVLPVSVVT